MKKILIIGTGIAGLTAAQTIRKEDADSSITMIGDEKFMPYKRIKLSKALDKDMTEAELLVKDLDWYRENKIDVVTGKSAKRIDSAAKKVELSDGSSADYDALVIATGSRAFVPPIKGVDKKGVFTLRNLDDSWAIREYAKDAKNVLIIGGGILGLENAFSLSKQGKHVTVLELGQSLMPRQLDQKAAEIITGSMKSRDADILFGVNVEEILGGDKVEGFRTSDSAVHDCDMVILSTGVRANLDLCEGSGIECNRGVVVDENMRTSVDGVYAAGDVIELNGRGYGQWITALAQGKVAGENILGKDSKFASDTVGVMDINCFDVECVSIGEVSDAASDYCVIVESPYRKICVKDDKAVGAIVFENPKLVISVKKLIDSGEPVTAAQLMELANSN